MGLAQIDLNVDSGDNSKLHAELTQQPDSKNVGDREIGIQAFWRPKIVGLLPDAGSKMPIFHQNWHEKRTAIMPLLQSIETRMQRMGKYIKRCAIIEHKFIHWAVDESAEADLEWVPLSEIARTLSFEHKIMVQNEIIDDTDISLTMRYIARKWDSLELFSIGGDFSGEHQTTLFNGIVEKLLAWNKTKYSKTWYITSLLTTEEETELQTLSQQALKCYSYMKAPGTGQLNISEKELTTIFKAINGMLSPTRIIIEK